MDPRHGYLQQHLAVARTLKPIQRDTTTEFIKRCMAKARYRAAWQSPNSRRADASEANGLGNLKCRDPPKWILFAALMNFGSKRQSLTAEIRNFIVRQNRNCEKQTNKPSQNSRVNAASAASVPLRNLGVSDF
jgi:hypothetical protein